MRPYTFSSLYISPFTYVYFLLCKYCEYILSPCQLFCKFKHNFFQNVCSGTIFNALDVQFSAFFNIIQLFIVRSGKKQLLFYATLCNSLIYFVHFAAILELDKIKPFLKHLSETSRGEPAVLPCIRFLSYFCVAMLLRIW